MFQKVADFWKKIFKSKSLETKGRKPVKPVVAYGIVESDDRHIHVGEIFNTAEDARAYALVMDRMLDKKHSIVKVRIQEVV